MEYQPAQIESKWQQYWNENSSFEPFDEDSQEGKAKEKNIS